MQGNIAAILTPRARADGGAEARLSDMLERYGEVCTRKMAAKLLGRCERTINAMLSDGRLETACAGQMVDVRSIARYISEPEAEEFRARAAKMSARHRTTWHV